MNEKEIMAKLINMAARRTQGISLMPLYELSDNQKTISAAKVLSLTEQIHEADKMEALELRRIVDAIRMR